MFVDFQGVSGRFNERLMKSTEKISYEPGIEAFEGAVPAWLILLSISLAVWGIYYLIAYWNGPVPTP